VFTAVGAGVFFYVRSQPRCIIEGTDIPKLLSADGSRLLTLEQHPDRGSTWRTWDRRAAIRMD
jgi:hypothetical protein